MLALRLGTTTAPIDLECTFCQIKLPARERFHIVETDPIHEEVATEFETTCYACMDAMKKAAMRLKIPIDFDVSPPRGTSVDMGHKIKDS